MQQFRSAAAESDGEKIEGSHITPKLEKKDLSFLISPTDREREAKQQQQQMTRSKNNDFKFVNLWSASLHLFYIPCFSPMAFAPMIFFPI